MHALSAYDVSSGTHSNTVEIMYGFLYCLASFPGWTKEPAWDSWYYYQNHQPHSQATISSLGIVSCPDPPEQRK